MPREALIAFFRFGLFVTVAAGLLVIATPPDTAEYVVSICSLMIGLTLTGLVVLVMRFTR